MSNGIKDLFGKSNNILSNASIKDIIGSDTPIESSEYIQQYIEEKKRHLPTIDFSTASNFAVYGSAEQYAIDGVRGIYNTYPYDGSATEKIEWLNGANFYDLYLFEFLYPRTCGYAVFSAGGWGTQASTVNEPATWGLPTTPQYIQLKAGPHADPDAATKSLAKQFPEPWDGKANLWDDTTGVNRVSNIALDPAQGITVEFWLKKDGYVSSSATTRYETIFDVWNGETGTTAGDSYGRFILLLDAGTTDSPTSMSAAGKSIHLAFCSGSAALTTDTTFSGNEILDNEWHHVAISVHSNSAGTEINSFLDGAHHGTVTESPALLGAVTGSLIANIGAARLPSFTQPQTVALSEAESVDGYGQLEGSIDEFRFWKTTRTPKEISRFWFTQIAGGTNTDNNKFSGSAAPVELGFYYKFNEGNTGDTDTDTIVLDYSGRISNGTWTGFVPDASRVAGPTSSAMIAAGASTTEWKDPIIYSSHPEVIALSSSLMQKGQDWDARNNSALYHTLPEWISSPDREENGETLKKLMQIMGVYFDTLQMQIKNVPVLASKEYPTTEIIRHDPHAMEYSLELGDDSEKTKVERYFNKPSPFSKNAVEDFGMVAPEIFSGVDALAQLASRDEVREFEKKLYDVKNTIYQNVYNNLTYIYKSKGTEKSLRNLIHCFGADDDLIKLNLYVDNTTYRYDDAQYHSKTIKRNYINFASFDRAQSTIYQSASLEISSDALSLLATSESRSMTFEADVIFPYKHPKSSKHWYHYEYLTSSLFGCHQAASADHHGWAVEDSASFQVHVLRDEEDGKDVRFMLTSSNGTFPTLTSSLYKDVYDNNRWTFAVRLYPKTALVGGSNINISGSAGAAGAEADWMLDFYGVNVALDQVQAQFQVTESIDVETATRDFLNQSKRIYAGAHRTHFSGSEVLQHTDIKLGSMAVWDDYLSNEEINMHAFDPNNIGRNNPYENAYLFDNTTDPNVDGAYLPRLKTQLLNWQFENVTGSSNGAVYTDYYGGSAWNSSFEVTDITSGSDEKWEVPARYKSHYSARGDWFLPSDTGSVTPTLIQVADQNLPETMAGDDTIQILDTDDRFFSRDSAPNNYYFVLEKSMAQTISKEMLDIIGSVAAFNNIVGEPINRYRQEYKSLEKMREMFFRRVSGEMDFNQFIDFYKWIDDALSSMLMELVPASANVSDGIKTVIESHILERNKYWTKFPTLEMKDEPIVGFVKGIKEMTYDWKRGHAPTPSSETDNCAWWSLRAEASGSTSGDTQVDDNRNTLRRVITSDVTTNKILATGEYTDPTNYPNAGIPNAAQFRFAQSGSANASRQEYKGSTFALRRFSKPYKTDFALSREIRSGHNIHRNNKGTDVLWARHRGRAGAASREWFDLDSTLAGYDPAPTCDDVVTPVELKKTKRYAFQLPSATTDAIELADGETKAASVIAPFTFFSQSSDIATGKPRIAMDSNTVYTNYHVDAYGPNQEVPLQGPFTERHVGGRQYRHADINTGNDSFATRAEGWQLFYAGEMIVPPNYHDTYLISADADGQPQFAQGTYYRDELAKRPMNIRNIQSSTSSFTLGNYYHPQQLVHTQDINTSPGFVKLIAATGSDGFYNLLAGVTSTVISDTVDRPKYKYFVQTLLDSASADEPIVHPFDAGHVNPLSLKHRIIERFSAPGGPETAGDSMGGFGLSNPTTQYSPNNSLNYRNLAVRTPLHGLYTAYTGQFGSFKGSTISATDTASAVSASFHKVHRNTDYDIRLTSTKAAYNSKSLLFDGSNDYYEASIARELKNFTISSWIRPTSTDISYINNMSTSVLGSQIFTSYLPTGDDAGKVVVGAKFSVDGTSVLDINYWMTTNPVISQNEWSNITVVWHQDGSDPTAPPKIYVNGQEVTVGDLSVVVTSDSAKPAWHWENIDEFMASLSSYAFTGYIQDMSLWNKALSPRQVKDIYHLPGYEAAGPGNLTMLSYVTDKEESNSLVGWWRFGANSVSTIDDDAPINTSADLFQNTAGNRATIEHSVVLPANYYSTTCASIRDNWYVQHPIPANDYGYAWITASANKDEGCDVLTTASFATASHFGSYAWHTNYNRYWGHDLDHLYASTLQAVPVDFAGMNSNIYEPVTSSDNLLGYPELLASNISSNFDVIQANYMNQAFVRGDGGLNEAGDETETTLGFPGIAALLNGILLHRNGPYGFPSWKMIRTGDHPIARNHKRNNILSVGEPPTTTKFIHQGNQLSVTELHGSSFTNYNEPLVSSKYKPLTHRVDIAQPDGTSHGITLRHSYANNLSMFANPTISNKLDVIKEDRQKYHDIRDTYIKSKLGAANPTKAFRTLIYAETIYPKEINTYLGDTRGRTSYSQTTAEVASASHGDHRIFWRDDRDDRQRTTTSTNDVGYAINSMGYKVWKNYNQGSASGDIDPGSPVPMAGLDVAYPLTSSLWHTGSVTWFMPSGALAMWPLDTGMDQPDNDAYSPAGDQYGYRVGELYMDPASTLYASLSKDDLNSMLTGSSYASAIFRINKEQLLKEGEWLAGHTVRGPASTYGGDEFTLVRGNDGGITTVRHGIWGAQTTGYPKYYAPASTHSADTGNAYIYWTTDTDNTGVDSAAERLAEAINGTSSFSAYHVGNLVYITQVGGAGSDGNTTITIASTPDGVRVLEVEAPFVGGTGGGGGDDTISHFMAETGSNEDRLFVCPGTASVCYNHFQLAGTTSNHAHGMLHGTNHNRRANEPNQIMAWKTAEFSGRNPWFDSYDAYAEDIRSVAKEYTVLPEFRISEHMDHYLENGFKADNYKFLELQGAVEDQSATAYDSGYINQFWTDYCHSDFMKYFGGIQSDHSDIAGISAISFKCSAVKKLLPYNGFYPVQRSIQLAGLFSASYGPYLTGSDAAHYGDDDSHGGKYFAERMQSMLQPFYAPGIMYNTIKSGIAVDYPVHTGSAYGVADIRGTAPDASPFYYEDDSGNDEGILHLGRPLSRRMVTTAPTFRMPFEAIVTPHAYLPTSQSADAPDPSAIPGALWLTAPYYGSGSFYSQWEGQQKPHYSMAANNFFAEIPNFFLETKTFNSFTSGKESAFKPMVSGSTYFMDVTLYKTNDFVSYEGPGSIDGDGTATPPHTDTNSLRGFGFGPSYQASQNTSNYRNVSDPSWAPHTPPYFYGKATARIKFSPHQHRYMEACESDVFSLDEILAGAEIETEFFSEVMAGTPAPEEYTSQILNTENEIASQHRMAVTSSVSLFGKTNNPRITYDMNGNPISAEDTIAGAASWVINTKFECPSLNFYGAQGGAYDTNGDIPDVPEKPDEVSWAAGGLNQRIRGVWNGYGTIPKNGAGLFVGVKESFGLGRQTTEGTCPDDLDTTKGGTGSLMQACGFRAEEKQIGVIAQSKIISEAIVAIPFVDVGGSRKFFALANTPSQSRKMFEDAVNGVEPRPGSVPLGKSIRTMADRMGRYNFPPHLDFMTDQTIEPFAMYIFEFTHKLSQQDLSHIWQNVMPDISVTAEKTAAAITHETGVNEFFRGAPIPKHTRWMVFKVKRKARDNYYKVTADTKDDAQFTFDFQATRKHTPDYTYNWPYDYFSLVELAKIDVKVGLGDGALPTAPNWAFPIGTTEAVASAAQAQAASQAATAGNIGENIASTMQATTAIIPPGLMVESAMMQAAAGWVGGLPGGPVVDAAAASPAAGGGTSGTPSPGGGFKPGGGF